VVFICLDQNGHTLSIANCGLPDVLIQDGKTGAIRHRIPSHVLPLGITRKHNPVGMNPHEVTTGDQIIVITDGFLEASNPEGEAFGDHRLTALIESGPAVDVFERMITGLDTFTSDTPQDDDVTLAVIPCRQWENNRQVVRQTDLNANQTDWQWEIVLRPQVLRRMDVIPMLLDVISEFLQTPDHKNTLFTVLSELLNNALDHGLLGLDSSVKNTPAGFAQYFNDRKNRLASLPDGYIRIGFCAQAAPEHGWLQIRVEDSGSGFDYVRWTPTPPGRHSYGMRGLTLVKGLCASLEFEGRGNIAKAVYAW
jgi:anti-sigma regulatory factor (Ser/Thr protein kinase)